MRTLLLDCNAASVEETYSNIDGVVLTTRTAYFFSDSRLTSVIDTVTLFSFYELLDV
jgi:hypothetical protein